jgi:sec-independent protein translocase protein TatC
MVKVLLGFGAANLTAQTEINFLLDLVFTMGMACGLVFQLPLVLAFLTAINVLEPRFLRAYWRHAVVLIFILAALLTPADPLSQVMLAIPLVVLYVASYGICTLIYRRKRAPTPPETDDAAGH